MQVQSVDRGDHRSLTLTDLPKERWESVTVDLTVARRNDGGGGPFTEGERLGAIQFYADAAADLILDNLLLYDAAVPGEIRPFPRRVLFAAAFDTGRPGKEWPGDFEIEDR